MKKLPHTERKTLIVIKSIDCVRNDSHHKKSKKIKAKILPDFEELTKSTKTIIALSNYIFHLDKIFK